MQRIPVLGLTALAIAMMLAVGLTVQRSAAQMAPDPRRHAFVAQAPFGTPSGEVRMQMHEQMSEQMSEHTILAGSVTQNVALGAPNFDAALGAPDMGSVKIAEQIGSLYGGEAEAQFLPLWRSHIQGYVDYTMAAGMGDEARKTQVRQGLMQWVQGQTRLLKVVNPALPAEVVSGGLETHVNGTLMAIDTFAARDFPRHYDVAHQAFMHSFVMGDLLAAGIVQQFPDRFAAQTVSASAR